MFAFSACRSAAIVTAMWLLIASTARAQHPGVVKVPWQVVQTPAEALAGGRIERELDALVDVDFHNATIDDLVQWLRNRGLPAQLDVHALDNVGFRRDTRLSFQQPGIQVRSALAAILRDCELTWMVANEMLLITTPEEAEKHPVIRAYDVRAIAVRVAPARVNEFWTSEYDLDSLVDAIEASVAPDTWDSVGGAGSLDALVLRGSIPVLVVSQTYDVQRQVGLLLESLQSLASTGSRTAESTWLGSSGLPRSNLRRTDLRAPLGAPRPGSVFPPAFAGGGGLLSVDTRPLVRPAPQSHSGNAVRDYE